MTWYDYDDLVDDDYECECKADDAAMTKRKILKIQRKKCKSIYTVTAAHSTVAS